MLRKVLHSKIHMATTTAVRPDYVGSLTVDKNLLDAVGMRASDAVVVANCRNGSRFETYIFLGEPGSGKVEVNGAAAHLVEEGDKLIVLHYAFMDDDEYRGHSPKVVVPDPDNTVGRVINYEPS